MTTLGSNTFVAAVSRAVRAAHRPEALHPPCHEGSAAPTNWILTISSPQEKDRLVRDMEERLTQPAKQDDRGDPLW